MTEPQPWPTTVQRRRGPGEADPVSWGRDHESPAHEIPTPRHGRPADRPEGSPVPSPFPRAHGAGAAPPQARAPGDPQPTHVRDVVGPRGAEASARAPQARPASAPAVVARDPRALTALRVITYLLVSLASLVFLAAVVYGGIRYLALRDAFSLPSFGTSIGSSAPDAGSAVCELDPTNPACRGG